MNNNRFPTKKRLVDFLHRVDTDYPVPLSQKVNLEEYAQKLMDKADIFWEVDASGNIQALVAGYIRGAVGDMAYLSLVGTLPEVRGKGKASCLVRQFLKACEEHGMHGVHLYTVAANLPAVRLYERLGFEEYVIDDEPRPEDLHLVYWCDETTNNNAFHRET